MSALPPRYHIRFHFREQRKRFWDLWMRSFEKKENTRDQLLMTIGAISCLYWQALGQGHEHLAGMIRKWWEKAAPLHKQGEQIL